MVVPTATTGLLARTGSGSLSTKSNNAGMPDESPASASPYQSSPLTNVFLPPGFVDQFGAQIDIEIGLLSVPT